MRAITVRTVESLSAKDAITGYTFDFEKQLHRFQRYIETSDWDEQLIRYAARFDRAFLYVVLILALAIFLSLSWSA